MLATFILNIHEKETLNTFISIVSGFDNPNSCAYDNHHSQFTLDANSPSNPSYY